jgi:peroxiredoxin
MIRESMTKWYRLTALILASGCACSQPSLDRADYGGKVPDKAEDVCPVLIGQSLPKLVLRTSDNVPFDLNAATAETPTVLIFFRGGWCPYCNLHLGQLQSIESELVQIGFQIIAVSPDRPEKLKGPAEKHGLKYRLLSDSEMIAAKALGIAFRVDDATVNKYKAAYGIDLEADSGQKHHLLPVPSVFLVGRDGIIQFSYVNPNYKVRIDPAVLLEAAKAVIRQSAVSKP